MAGGNIVRDAAGEPLAYVYDYDKPRQADGVPSALTIDEVHQMARSIAKLPDVLLERDSAQRRLDHRGPPPSAGKVA